MVPAFVGSMDVAAVTDNPDEGDTLLCRAEDAP